MKSPVTWGQTLIPAATGVSCCVCLCVHIYVLDRVTFCQCHTVVAVLFSTLCMGTVSEREQRVTEGVF